MQKLIRLLFLLALTALSASAGQKPKYGISNDTMGSLNRLKALFNARIIGLELYSPLSLPEINEDDTKDSALKKLKKADFDIMEQDQIVNVIDAKKRPTGQKAYPFDQRINIAPGKYGIEDLCRAIKKQVDFGIDTMNLQRQTWLIAFDFQEHTTLSVRETLNLMAGKVRGIWVAERDSFMVNMSTKAGEFIRTDHPKLKEDDAGVLYLQ